MCERRAIRRVGWRVLLTLLLLLVFSCEYRGDSEGESESSVLGSLGQALSSDQQRALAREPAPPNASSLQGTLRASSAGEGSPALALASEVLSFSLDVPRPHGPADVVLSATERLRLNDRTRVGPDGGAEIAASRGDTHMAAEAAVRGSVFADGDIFLGSRSRITGTLTVSGNVTRQDGVQIGSEIHVASIPFDTISFTVPVPDTISGDVRLEPDRSASVAPGRYGVFDVKSRSDVFLTAGTYIFESFNLEPQAEIFLDKSAGPIRIFVRSSFNFKGDFVQNGGARGDLLVGYLGSSEAFVQGPFVGTFVAPDAEIALHRPNTNAPHEGAFFGRSIQVFSDATVLHVPFPWPDIDDDGFPPVGPDDVPPQTPPGTPIDPQCGPEFNAVINPLVDANSDGFPDIVSFSPAAIAPGCLPPTFCQRVTQPNGAEGFVPVPSTPVLHPALPVPIGALSVGCAGEPAAPVCPILGSTGAQAIGCEALPADPACLTVTMCPDPGSWDDPSNPDVRHIFDGVSSDVRPFDLPEGVTEAATDQILSVLNELGPLYINPCEWDPVLNEFSFDLDIRGPGGQEGGTFCFSNTDCKSRVCAPSVPPTPIGGTCTDAVSSVKLNVDEGSSNWNVHFDAGLSQGRVNVRRAVFFPSAEFDAVVHTDALLTATAMGHTFHLYDLDILSQISECGFNFDWSSRSGDDAFDVVDGLIRENLGVGVFVPGNVADLQAASDPTAAANCELLLTALHNAERQVNESLHDALIASTFYNLAGPNGTIVTSQTVAQNFIDNYTQATADYEAALAAFEAAQQTALDHDVAGEIAAFELQLELAFVRSYGIGPFNPSLELGVYGRVGMADVSMQNTANTHFTNTPETPCIGEECFEITVSGNATPRAAAGLFAFIGGGINLVVAGGRVGIRGELDLANMQLPLAASFALKRTTLTPGQFLQASPLVPPALASLFGTPADLLTEALFEVPPRLAQFAAPFAIGSHLQPLEGPSVQVQFLSGRILLWAKAWFLFVTKKWEKTLVSWPGIEREWHVGQPLGGNAFGPLTSFAGLLAAPNMVLMPKLALSPIPGFADPVATSNAINNALDTQISENFNIRFNAHHEQDLSAPWVLGGRCDTVAPPG